MPDVSPIQHTGGAMTTVLEVLAVVGYIAFVGLAFYWLWQRRERVKRREER